MINQFKKSKIKKILIHNKFSRIPKAYRIPKKRQKIFGAFRMIKNYKNYIINIIKNGSKSEK